MLKSERRTRIGARAGGFTLIELLVTISIIAVLLALLLPALAGTMRAARGFKCQMAQRSVAFDFHLFAEDKFPGGRGEDDRLYGNRFRVETFQDAQYGVDEFWAWGDTQVKNLPDAAGNDPMRCPEVKGEVTLRRSLPCSSGAVTPSEHVSFAFNMRLHVTQDDDQTGSPRVSPALLTESVIDDASVPLFWDVDGDLAARRGLSPVFSAPALGEGGIYTDDPYWFLGDRHNGAANFAFVDGHVETSRTPLREAGWNWSFSPSH